jgi:hypothetical protein
MRPLCCIDVKFGVPNQEQKRTLVVLIVKPEAEPESVYVPGVCVESVPAVSSPPADEPSAAIAVRCALLGICTTCQRQRRRDQEGWSSVRRKRWVRSRRS